MQAHYSVLIHTLDLWGGVKTFLLKVAMLHIKVKGMEHITPLQAHILFFSYTPNLWGGLQRSKHSFTESCRVAYQIKGNGS